MYGVDAQKWLQLGAVGFGFVPLLIRPLLLPLKCRQVLLVSLSSRLFLSRVHLNLQLVSLFRTCSSSHFSDSVEHDDRDHYYSSACKIQQCLPFIEIRARDGTVAQHPEATRPKSETDKSGQKN